MCNRDYLKERHRERDFEFEEERVSWVGFLQKNRREAAGCLEIWMRKICVSKSKKKSNNGEGEGSDKTNGL